MTNEIIKSVISVWNDATGSRMRFNTPANTRLVTMCIMDDGSNSYEVKEYIRDYVKSHEHPDFTECFESFPNKPVKDLNKEAKNETSALLEKLIESFATVFTKEKSNEIEDRVFESCELKLDNYIKENYGYIPHKTYLTINDKPAKIVDGVIHKKFNKVFKKVSINEPVFLVGPAGSGKNYLCEQIANVLELPFYFSNALTQEYMLTGFTDAMGNYQPTQFYEAWTKGGLFLLDELDASVPEVLIKLNAALANRYMDFPVPIGKIEAHPNFRVIAAGNTFGLGADIQYVGRNKLDMASLDRFAQVKVDYDPRIELNMAQGDQELVDFAHDVRQSVSRNGILMIFSYRAISRLTRVIQVSINDPEYDLGEELQECVFKSLNKDDLSNIYNNLNNTENKYAKGLKSLIDSM